MTGDAGDEPLSPPAPRSRRVRFAERMPRRAEIFDTPESCTVRPRAASVARRRVSSVRDQDGFDFEPDLDVVPNRDSTTFDHLIPGEVEVASVNLLAAALKPDRSLPQLILDPPFVGDVEDDRTRAAMHGQISSDAQASFASALTRVEWKVISETSRRRRNRGLEVRVALIVSRVDGGGCDDHVDLRASDVVLIDADHPAHVREATPDGGDHEMLHGELDAGVGGGRSATV